MPAVTLTHSSLPSFSQSMFNWIYKMVSARRKQEKGVVPAWVAPAPVEKAAGKRKRSVPVDELEGGEDVD